MGEFHEIWIEQCEAARDIREAFGLPKALGYLLGEKLLNFLRAADEDPAFGELPRFVAEIKQIFDRAEIETYLDTVHRVGALGHVGTCLCWASLALTAHRGRRTMPRKTQRTPGCISNLHG